MHFEKRKNKQESLLCNILVVQKSHGTYLIIAQIRLFIMSFLISPSNCSRIFSAFVILFVSVLHVNRSTSRSYISANCIFTRPTESQSSSIKFEGWHVKHIYYRASFLRFDLISFFPFLSLYGFSNRENTVNGVIAAGDCKICKDTRDEPKDSEGSSLLCALKPRKRKERRESCCQERKLIRYLIEI